MMPEQEKQMQEAWYEAREKSHGCQLHPRDSFEYAWSKRQLEIDALTARAEAAEKKLQNSIAFERNATSQMQDWMDKAKAAEESAKRINIEKNCAEARVAELQSIVDRLPKTADGVIVLPKSEFWHLDKEGYAHCHVADGFEFYKEKPIITSKTCLIAFSGDEVYSTREAAFAAQTSSKP